MYRQKDWSERGQTADKNMSVESTIRTDVNKNQIQISKWSKITYTLIIYWVHMTFGISLAVIGPTFVDFKYIMNTSMNNISLMAIIMNSGHMFGFIFSFFYKYINRQISFIMLLTISGMAYLFMPYSSQLWQLYLLVWISFFGAGVTDIGNNVWLIEMWQQQCGPILQMSGFAYGIGIIIGPLIDKPFLTGHIAADDINATVLTVVDRRSQIKIPYYISGIITIIGALLLAIMLIIEKYEYLPPRDTYEDIDSNDKTSSSAAKKSRNSVIIFVILNGIFLAFYMSTEILYLEFISTYLQYIPLKLSAKKAAEIASASALCYTIGRGISALVAIKVKPQRLIQSHFCIIFIAMSIIIFGQQYIALVWVGCLSAGFGFSPIYAAIYSLIKQHMEVDDKVAGFLLFSTDSINVLLPYVLGLHIETMPDLFIYLIVFNVFISVVVFAAIVYSVRRFKL